jgi:hypothetical protein
MNSDMEGAQVLRATRSFFKTRDTDHSKLISNLASWPFGPFRPFLRRKGKKGEKVSDLKRSESLDLIKAKRREKSPVKPTEKVSKKVPKRS